MRPNAIALRRSLDTYWRDAERVARMHALDARFVGPGALAFEIGAHLGDRTASFLRLGARVVAVEPQPRMVRALRLLFHRADRVALEQVAVGRTAGRARLHVNSANPTVSTLDSGFVSAAAGHPNWQGQRWDDSVEVPVTTLDALIAWRGRPDFVKTGCWTPTTSSSSIRRRRWDTSPSTAWPRPTCFWCRWARPSWNSS